MEELQYGGNISDRLEEVRKNISSRNIFQKGVMTTRENNSMS